MVNYLPFCPLNMSLYPYLDFFFFDHYKSNKSWKLQQFIYSIKNPLTVKKWHILAVVLINQSVYKQHTLNSFILKGVTEEKMTTHITCPF